MIPQGNYQEAVEWYEKSIKIKERIGEQKGLATTYSNIGILYLEIGKKDIAKQYLQKIYELYLQLNLKSQAEKIKQLIDRIY